LLLLFHVDAASMKTDKVVSGMQAERTAFSLHPASWLLLCKLLIQSLRPFIMFLFPLWWKHPLQMLVKSIISKWPNYGGCWREDPQPPGPLCIQRF